MSKQDVPPKNAVLDVEVLQVPWQTEDPFLFCVHHNDAYPKGNAKMGPAASLSGRNIGMDFGGKEGWSMYHGEVIPGFPRHPHRGFETITAVQKGFIDHSDSLGATARFGAGDVQWMTAGNGIEHAEMFPLREMHDDNPLELFQIWLNLPRKSKRVRPSFSMFWNENVEKRHVKDAQGRATEMRLIAGSLDLSTAHLEGDDVKIEPPRLGGVAAPPDSWAHQADAGVVIATLGIPPGGHFKLPAAQPDASRTLYFYQGNQLLVDDVEIPEGHRVLLQGDASPTLVAGAEGCSLLLLQGRPIGEPVVHYGPFVMNSAEEINEAVRDYQRDQFGFSWPWKTSAPVHERRKGRFAKHADGRIETPKKRT
ncbi:MAG: pirin family protein [Deltaproteobacteria bacterium]|nr:pirin family protein [Deltaproteobacteria bacterium]